MNFLKSNRRSFLAVLGGLAPAAAVLVAAETSPKKKTVKVAQFDATGKLTGVVEVEKVEKPDAEWKKQLTPEQFEVTRREGTERPFTGKYADNHADGL
jgi:peptide-methionine (R)-S-oxide reductase